MGAPGAPGRRVTIGLDVGGTKVAGGLVAPDGSIIARRAAPALAGGQRDPGLAITRRMAGQLLADARQAGLTVDGIGAGFPEYVDSRGQLTSRLVVDWDIQPARLLGDLGPVTVESDVRCGAIGEAAFGSGRGLGSFAYVSVGTGISSCIVAGGVPWSGHRGEAIALGELPVAPDVDPRCGCTLEQYASGAGIGARYLARTGQPTDGARPVLDAARQGDAAAAGIVATAAGALAAGLAWLVQLTDPEAVILGGGLGHAGGPWLAAVAREYRRRVAARPDPPHLLTGALGPAAGIVGAARASQDTARAGSRPGPPVRL